MEVNEGIHDPDSNFENLVRQVEEQSEFCDVTVRFGDWTRKFHRCVLSASVLFQTIINARIKETKKGNGDVLSDTLPDAQLEVKIDTSPDVVEMAIMSMYGIIPDLDIRNIGDFLELAEYLKIRELKDTCVDWLDHVDYSEVNCMHVVHLSRKFKFAITPCIEYIESHIPETFLQADSVDLPTDIVEYLFTDVKFSYVDMDDKLNFLVKLTNRHPIRSIKEIVVQLFNTIDLNEVSDRAWEHANSDINFIGMVNLRNKVLSKDQENSRKCVIVVLSDEDYFACLDLENDIWYRLNSRFFEIYSYYDIEILGIRNNSPKMYFKDKNDDWYDLALILVDLESDELHRYSLEMEFLGVLDGEILDIDITHVNFTNNTLITIAQKTFRMYKFSASSESESESERDSEHDSELESDHAVEEENVNDGNEGFQVHVPVEVIPNTGTDDVPSVMQAPGICIDEPSIPSPRLSSSDCERDGLINCTEVYIGNATEEVVEMHPLFSFRKERITQICMNFQSVLVLFTKSGGLMHVILYDLLQFKLERIFSVHEEKYELCATDNGFLLHNDFHCYCFTYQGGPISSESYKMEKFMLENKEEWFVKYHYHGGFWMRILRRSMHNDIELQYISHEDLSVCYASLDVNWRNVSMPKDKYLFEKVMNFENIFIVPLTKEKLRCNIACPHCKYLEF